VRCLPLIFMSRVALPIGSWAERLKRLPQLECVGDARFFVDRATSYAKSRMVFGRPMVKTRASNFRLRAPTCRRRLRA
jgi:hypothetical protein